MKFTYHFIFLFFILIIFSCAKIGYPPGGIKDIIPPQLIYVSPPKLSKNIPVNIKKIQFHFNELILLENPFTEIIISPPIKKFPLIFPNNFSSREIIIQFRENLIKNTTYSINFGESIRDNNEGNILSNFNYVFSTGKTIDSLQISGKVFYFNKKINNNNTVVSLYKADPKINFREKPYYITKVNNTGNYKFENLKKGKYKIIAFNDINCNKIFDEEKEQIGFLNTRIDLDKDQTINLIINEVKKMYKFIKVQQEEFGKIFFKVEGNPTSLFLSVINSSIKDFKIIHEEQSNSLYFWFNPLNIENKEGKNQEEIQFILKNEYQIDTIRMFYHMNTKKPNKFNLLEKQSYELIPNNDFFLTFIRPIKNIDSNKITIIKNQKEIIPFKYKISDSNAKNIYFKFPISFNTMYDIKLDSGAITDIFNCVNNSIQLSYKTKTENNFGKLIIHLTKPIKSNFFLEILDKNGNSIYKEYFNKSHNIFEYFLYPGEYSPRILVDENENGIYDFADFKKQIAAETVFLYQKNILIPPLWEVKETWDINYN